MLEEGSKVPDPLQEMVIWMLFSTPHSNKVCLGRPTRRGTGDRCCCHPWIFLSPSLPSPSLSFTHFRYLRFHSPIIPLFFGSVIYVGKNIIGLSLLLATTKVEQGCSIAMICCSFCTKRNSFFPFSTNLKGFGYPIISTYISIEISCCSNAIRNAFRIHEKRAANCSIWQ